MNSSDQPDYSRLLDLDVLSAWTLDRQRDHAAYEDAYEHALAAIQSGLRQQHIDGDGRFAPQLRARKVERHLKALVKAEKQARKEAEKLRTSYAEHTARVTALPGQRAEKARQKELKRASKGRRAALEGATAKGLHKMATAASEDESAGGQAAGIGDLWRQQGRSA